MIRVLVLGAIWRRERSFLQFTRRFLNAVMTEFAPEIFWPTKYTVGQHSSVGIATRYGLDVWGIESRYRATFSAHFHNGHGNNLPSSAMDTVPFPGVQRPERVLDHSTSFSAEDKERLKERVELYFYPCLGFCGLFEDENYPSLPSATLLPQLKH